MIFVEGKIEDCRDCEGLEKEVVVLGWEGRRKSRQRVFTVRGTEMAIALPTGSVLLNGDVLYADEARCIVVEAAPEDVLSVRPGSNVEFASIAHEIGNRHLPICIFEDSLMTVYDPFFEDFLKKTGVDYLRKKDIFEPLKRGHSHG